MKNVLVAVDGSEAALKAARLGMELAQAFGAKLTVLHVVSPMIVPSDAPWAPLQELLEVELERGQAIVQEVQRALGNVLTGELVKVGPPAQTIVDVAESLPADLVVVGGTGKGAVQRLLLGSVADRVVHLSHGPVLVAR